MPITDIHYKTFPVDSVDQAVSLTNYLVSHGVDAMREGADAVTCPVSDDEDQDRLINQLRKNWKLFWEHSDAELFTSTPIFLKTAFNSDGGCPHCGVGPIVE